MGCAKSKNKSNDEIYSKAEMEGRTRRYGSSRKSNDSLTITVIWRRLSMFSRRGSVRKQSTEVRTVSSLRSAAITKSPSLPEAPSLEESPSLPESQSLLSSPDFGAAESQGPEEERQRQRQRQQQEEELSNQEEDRGNR